MKTYDTTLLGREDLASSTIAWRFEKPDGFSFKPGQAIDIELRQGFPGAEQDRQRTFSLVSAPHQTELMIATRLRGSAFKRALNDAAVGSAVTIKGPSGSLILHNNPDREAVLIAGGIGITPFMSMLRHQARTETPRHLLLIYSNRRPEDAAFLDELERLEERIDGFRLIATMTDTAGSNKNWSGETRRIDAAMLAETCRDYSLPIYYVVGPPAMAEGLRTALNAAGVNDDDIRSEEFFGY